MERDGISYSGSNRGTEIPEQSRPSGADVVSILGVLWISLQPQGLVITPPRTRGLIAYPITEPRVVEERRLSVVGEALIEAASDWRGEFVVEPSDSMDHGMGELVHADVTRPRRGMRPIGKSDHLLARKERTDLRCDGPVLNSNGQRAEELVVEYVRP